jgi:putative molybdopterin biosynthesis protein
MKRNIYLQMKTLEEARRIFLDRASTKGLLRHEIISSVEAVGRITASSVTARFSSPPFHVAAMDGIAARAENTFGTTVDRPKRLKIGQDAFYVNTGNILPPNTDAVIMIEYVTEIDEETIEIESAAFPWQHVRKVGEDIVATELLFAQNHKITPCCVGALLGGGVFEVAVKEKPRVAIIPTGSELIRYQDLGPHNLAPGQVIESNSAILSNLVNACGGVHVSHPIVPDEYDLIRDAVDEAVTKKNHIILMIAGSSAGSEDYSAKVIGELGEVLVHGVTMMPGKPTILGIIKGKPIIGIPGYPVSAIMAFEQFVQPLICRMLGSREPMRDTIPIRLPKKIPSKLGIEEFVRVKLGKVGDTIVATPLPRGAGSITTITEADGIIRIPSHVEGIKEEETVTAELLKTPEEISNTIVVVGSHDNTLDVLADEIKAKNDQFRLSSSHVGSLGGLMALKKGICHVAGSHLLDAKTGSYNISYIKRYLPDLPVKVINLVVRQQGLIVLRDNPKGIKGIDDLVREDITFINRQAGSGTRVLLDYRLEQLGIDPERIRGYDTEEFTHMSIAACVLSGRADCGLGIYAAAKALDLGFIPIVTEQYDLIIPKRFFTEETIQLMLRVIRSDTFKRRVEKLGGYDTGSTGKVVYQSSPSLIKNKRAVERTTIPEAR